MNRFDRIAALLIVVAVGLALAPGVRLAMDWWMVRGYLTATLAEPMGSADGFDWVSWQDSDGQIEAGWVTPGGAADQAGLRTGDRFYMLEYQQYFDIDDLRASIRGVRPGTERTYLVERDGEYIEAVVRFTRSPTFLYPRSAALWQFALWGFALGAFVHLIALFVARPLARRSQEARFEFVLISVSAAWIFGNLLRLAGITLFGAPGAGTLFDIVFQALTLIGLAGWIGFPALLLYAVLRDAVRTRSGIHRVLKTAIYIPPVLLGLGLITMVARGHVGPLSVESLLVPILFYASTYIAAAAALVQVAYLMRPGEVNRVFGGWGRPGSAVILGFALLAVLAAQNVVPVLSLFSETGAGWVIVSAQLLAIAPVTLYSFGTLRHGKMEDVISRALVYLVVLGGIFFVFVAVMTLAEPYVGTSGPSRHVLAGIFVVVLLLVADRLGRRLRGVASTFFRSGREKARQSISRFQEQMQDLLDPDVLCRRTVDTISEAFGARSAILYLQVTGPDARWISATYHPEPPYLTEQVFGLIWPHFVDDPRIWAGNPELDERHLPDDAHAMLAERGAALAIPIRGAARSVGMVILGTRRQGGSVYNLEDLDMLRSVGGQLAIAVDRIALVEREKDLARETSEARLVALRSQINPHFLFNALNTILAHIAEQPDAAEASVEHLASIFRYTLQAGDRSYVCLEDELSLVRHYLNVEQARFGAKLEVDIDVDPALKAFPVPAFAVQTLVENAVKHGIERKRKGGRLSISAKAKEDGSALIRVSDTGVGIPALFDRTEPISGPQPFHGIGLQNVTARLRLLYERDDLLSFWSRPDEGTSIQLLLPVRQDEAGSGGACEPVLVPFSSDSPIASLP